MAGEPLIFEAHWVPSKQCAIRSLCHGQELDLPLVLPVGGAVRVIGEVLQSPDESRRCRVIGLRSNTHGRLQAASLVDAHFELRLADGAVAAGGGEPLVVTLSDISPS